MERELAGWREPSLEQEWARLKSTGHYIDPADPRKWIEFWQMCERNGKGLQELEDILSRTGSWEQP